jgi:hypothetical protein
MELFFLSLLRFFGSWRSIEGLNQLQLIFLKSWLKSPLDNILKSQVDHGDGSVRSLPLWQWQKVKILLYQSRGRDGSGFAIAAIGTS